MNSVEKQTPRKKLRETLDGILLEGESIRAKVGGRPEESTIKGQVVLASRGLMLATDRRVLVLDRTGNDNYYLSAALGYDRLSEAKYYRDLFSGTLAMTYTLHLQDNDGAVYRLVAVEEEKASVFVDFVRAMMEASGA